MSHTRLPDQEPPTERELAAAYSEITRALDAVYGALERAVEETLTEPPPGWAGRIVGAATGECEL